MTELLHKLKQYMQSLGFDIIDHTKKHIRRNLESHFGNSLCIINDNGKLLVIPENLTREDLARQNIALSEKIKVYEGDKNNIEHLLLTAKLQEEHIETYVSFTDGRFSVQLGDKNPFGRIPVDQVVEETVNKDTQTAGGTKGFSLKPGTVSKYYLTAEYRSACLNKFREMIELTNHNLQHLELEKMKLMSST